MNRLLIFILLSLISCSKREIEIDSSFAKIDKKLKDKTALIEKIVPDNNYRFWQYASIRGGLTNGDKITMMKFGDTLSSQKNKIINPKKGFNLGEFLSYSYIAYMDEDSIKYVTNEKDLKKFIGNIDNLEEAILILYMNDLTFDPQEVKAGSFKKNKNGFELYMMKYYNCPVKKESIKVEIDFKGNFKTKSNGVYYESTDCIMT
ncbi:hypothetical protein [Flavobacterium sp. H122]|uniref:hypothetical protein n=1 Tax=Flavobacterium sp. H122 TaxID=2529860 RepID=UPI0010AA2424|nr:hypothetical protein [Flavobacterium sp. H122]